MREGIYAAGNWIIDEVKIIDEYPHQDGLTNVRSVKSNNGGAPYNMLKDLAMLKDAYRSVEAHVAKGRTTDEIVAANPLAKYHDGYNWGFITTERMTRTLCRELGAK